MTTTSPDGTPSGTWTLDETLVIGSNVSMIGQGREASTLKAGSDIDYMVSVLAGSENLHFERLHFEGNGRSTCIRADA